MLAHRLHNPELSDEENRRIFGECYNPNGDEHNYTVEVTVSGQPDPISGVMLSLDDLDRVVKERVVSVLDHKHLNLDMPHFLAVVPTKENVFRAIWDWLYGHVPGRPRKVGLQETENNCF